MFFSLDRPVTKDQIVNTKCQPKVFDVNSIPALTVDPSLFQIEKTINLKVMLNVFTLSKSTNRLSEGFNQQLEIINI